MDLVKFARTQAFSFSTPIPSVISLASPPRTLSRLRLESLDRRIQVRRHLACRQQTGKASYKKKQKIIFGSLMGLSSQHKSRDNSQALDPVGTSSPCDGRGNIPTMGLHSLIWENLHKPKNETDMEELLAQFCRVT